MCENVREGSAADTLSVCAVEEMCGEDVWINSCRMLTGEMCKLVYRNMVFIDGWVALKRAVVPGIP